MRFHLLSLFALPFVLPSTIADQIPLRPAQMSDIFTPLTNAKPTVADLLTIEPSASIFFSYARELELSVQFNDGDARNTLFVPTNKAVMALARKPHQSPPVHPGVILTEAQLDAQSKQNVERWISAHIIPKHLVTLSSGVYNTLLDGQPLTINGVSGGTDSPDWTRVVLNDGIRIISAKEASNGVVYMIDRAVKSD